MKHPFGIKTQLFRRDSYPSVTTPPESLYPERVLSFALFKETCFWSHRVMMPDQSCASQPPSETRRHLPAVSTLLTTSSMTELFTTYSRPLVVAAIQMTPANYRQHLANGQPPPSQEKILIQARGFAPTAGFAIASGGQCHRDYPAHRFGPGGVAAKGRGCLGRVEPLLQFTDRPSSTMLNSQKPSGKAAIRFRSALS